jgi:protein-disulfide isomerase
MDAGYWVGKKGPMKMRRHLSPPWTSAIKAVAVVLAVFMLIAGPAPNEALAQIETLSPAQRQAVEDAVGDYLRKHPEIVIEAIKILRQREQASEDAQTGNVVAARGSELFNDPATPVGGNPDGDVTLVEFFDYRCGYCKRVFPTIKKLIEDDGKIRFVYKEFPILGPASVYAARAALASREQGKYEAFHDALMAAKGALTEDKVLRIAEAVGLDRGVLLDAMTRNEAEYDRIFAKNRDLAQALRINGTPAFVAGDVVVRGAADYQSMKNVIAQVRSKP